MLAAGNAPSGPDGWQFEPKLDGQRLLATVVHGRVTLRSRPGADITAVYPELVGEGSRLPVEDLVVDGEVVACNQFDRPDFGLLQRRMHVRHPTPRLLAEVPVIFAIFDLLWADGVPLWDRPLAERRERLALMGLAGGRWQTVVLLDHPHEDLLATCAELGMEGYMAKRLSSTYQPGKRSKDWAKVKCFRRREFVGCLPV